jgi:hypothetical protein
MLSSPPNCITDADLRGFGPVVAHDMFSIKCVGVLNGRLWKVQTDSVDNPQYV